MKLRSLILMTAALGLVASPAMAKLRHYTWTANTRVCTITEPCDNGGTTGVGGRFSPAGSWEGPYTHMVVEDNNGGPTPSIVSLIIHNTNRTLYLTSATTGVPGSTAVVTTDVKSASTPLGPGSRVGNTVNWGNLSVVIVGGLGQYCTETAPGGCASAGISPNVWGSFIPPNTPINSDPWTIAPDFSTGHSSTLFRYFDLNPILGVNIYGELDNQTTTETVKGVPVLAPLGAMGLVSSLFYMGVRTLRRKQA